MEPVSDFWMSLESDGSLDTHERNAKICRYHIELVLCSFLSTYMLCAQS